MPAIRSTGDIASKWSRVTSTRQQDFQAGVQNPRKDWAGQTEAAAQAWAAGVQEAVGNGSFVRGVASAGTPKWQRKTLDVGVQRWPQGVQAAQPDYAKGFDKFRTVILNTTLPPRGPKGSPQNIQRVTVMAAALHQAKLSG